MENKKEKSTFWNRNKDRVLYFLIIELFGVVIFPYLKSCLIKEKHETPIQPITAISFKADSGIVNHAEVHQDGNKGTIKNEFIGRDNNVSTKIINIKKKDSSIINNGFLNQGGKDNTYNQTIKPAIEQRHISIDEEKWMLDNLNKDYKIEVNVCWGIKKVKYMQKRLMCI